MNLEEQVRIMEVQLSSFTSIIEKKMYLDLFFKPDPTFTDEARNIIFNKLADGDIL